MATNKKGLGKGLGALFSAPMMTEIDNLGEDKITILQINEIKPNKDQPRKIFDEKALADLSESIKEHGVLQPILVRPDKIGGYQIVAGERRWRASKLAGLTQVPVIIKNLEDLETMEIALIENLQRANLNVIEEAMGYKYLMERHGMSQDEVAKKVGKSRPVIANSIRLLGLPEEVIELVRSEKISAGHARALLAFGDEEKIKREAEKILKGHLSVREIEEAAKNEKIQESLDSEAKTKDKVVSGQREVFYRDLEKKFRSNNNRYIKINNRKTKKSLEIEFYSDEDLEKIILKLGEK